ncbi:hypothetical protein TNCV_615371 [Trichonephila clavipes]|nr:hypothetical protein TNCV_615371 [Trichonephila clavipes]
MEHKEILELVQSPKNILDADSCVENEMNNAASVPTSLGIRNFKKIMLSYFDEHSIGEMNNKKEEIKRFVENLMLKKTEVVPHQRPISRRE